MNKPDIYPFRLTVAARGLSFVVVMSIACLLVSVQPIRAAEWHGLTPLKSRRADVERELGTPLSADAASGIASATTSAMVTPAPARARWSPPRFPVPQSAEERCSPPRFPLPQRAFERVPLGVPSVRAIPLLLPRRARSRNAAVMLLTQPLRIAGDAQSP